VHFWYLTIAFTPFLRHPTKLNKAQNVLIQVVFNFRCLVKNPLERASASELLNMEFIKRAKPSETLREMIAEAQSIKEELQSRKLSVSQSNSTLLHSDIIFMNFSFLDF
jgi:hypothetical protein